MNRNHALAAFLRDRRGKVEPADVGLPHQDGRRVPGLRREEVAQLARVSPDYYTRLEQGRQPTASPSVLGALSQALRLSPEEHAHLCTLAGVPAPIARTDRSASRVVGPGAQRFMDLLGDTPAILFGPFIDVVSVNRAGAFLFADFNRLPAAERNGLRWMFLSPTARERYQDSWQQAASEMVGMLRLDAGRHPGHPRLAEIVDDLSGRSELFSSLWSAITVSEWNLDHKVLHHPAFGGMRFRNEFVSLHSAPGQTLVVVIPDDQTAFHRALA
ncbi:helix-turn-helix transcriptional regulator [Streptomyces sp. NPDC088354]|uniref:helix-turn-helix transcriptional regulator n=1 Tax=unclassified Streptomyces TaxID=2593676 RepID=UPI0029A78796|nr:helix-turn-helix transcriptional regulator [Streptomyces sp. MI02-7b]MDX3074949.1 helix-turn-helix transcriptional regulator [Streptomyces sp. MI02-7b]